MCMRRNVDNCRLSKKVAAKYLQSMIVWVSFCLMPSVHAVDDIFDNIYNEWMNMVCLK